MSETLTEQWKNGELKDGWYYILFTNEKLIGIDGCTDSVFWHTDNKILKVLTPVPTYEEWEELQESNDGLSKLMFKSLMNRFVKADEERERLEEQLKEANEVIENMKLCMDDKYDYDCVAEDVDIYLEKWGVK
jgi:hypothetical protein